MIDGKKVIAFTPSGRERYMNILWHYVEREHAAGNIDEWIVFNNAYTRADDAYTRALAQRGDWITVLSDGLLPQNRKPETIHRFYHSLRDQNAVYVRLDDDICYVEKTAIQTLVRHKLENTDLFLSFPVIINNTRMSYFLQQHGHIPEEWGKLQDIFLEPTAWRSGEFAEKLHRKALNAIHERTLIDDFFLPNMVLKGRSSEGTAYNHVSVNSFAILGADMAACQVTRDEEGYLSDTRPGTLGRFNGICGDAIVNHFAYHPQTRHMEGTGLLEEYRATALCKGHSIR